MENNGDQSLWQRLKQSKAFTDAAGVTLIILSGLLGWLPGPGGIPLFYAGLRFLALHHKWAQDLLDYFSREGLQLLDKLFPERHKIMLLWDTFVIIAISLALYLTIWREGRLVSVLGFAMFVWALVAFLRNRNRYTRAKKRLRRNSDS